MNAPDDPEQPGDREGPDDPEQPGEREGRPYISVKQYQNERGRCLLTL